MATLITLALIRNITVRCSTYCAMYVHRVCQESGYDRRDTRYWYKKCMLSSFKHRKEKFVFLSVRDTQQILNCVLHAPFYFELKIPFLYISAFHTLFIIKLVLCDFPLFCLHLLFLLHQLRCKRSYPDIFMLFPVL